MPQNKKHKKISNRSGKTSSKALDNDSTTSLNQKKMHKSISFINQKDHKQNNNYTKFSTKIFRDSNYMSEFIKEVKSNNTLVKCMKFPDSETKKDGKFIIVNNLYSHIKYKQHLNNTPADEKDKLNELIRLISEKVTEKVTDQKHKEKNTKILKIIFILLHLCSDKIYLILR